MWRRLLFFFLSKKSKRYNRIVSGKIGDYLIEPINEPAPVEKANAIVRVLQTRPFGVRMRANLLAHGENLDLLFTSNHPVPFERRSTAFKGGLPSATRRIFSTTAAAALLGDAVEAICGVIRILGWRHKGLFGGNGSTS